MMRQARRGALLLDRYWAALRLDRSAPPPEGLDPDLAALAALLERELQPHDASAVFLNRLEHRLVTEAREKAAGQATIATTWPHPLRPRIDAEHVGRTTAPRPGEWDEEPLRLPGERLAWGRELLRLAAAALVFALVGAVLVLALRGGREQQAADPPTTPTPAPFDGVELVWRMAADAAIWTASPGSVAVSEQGLVYVAAPMESRVLSLDDAGRLVRSVGGLGSDPGEFGHEQPGGLAVDHEGNLYVADSLNARIQMFAPDGTVLLAWGQRGFEDGQFLAPYGIGVDAAGNVYVGDSTLQRIQKFDSSGRFLLSWDGSGSGDGAFQHVQSIAVDGAGNVYVIDSGRQRVQKFDSQGRFLLAWGARGDGPGAFSGATSIAVDVAGRVFVADYFNHRVQVFDAQGRWLADITGQESGDGQLDRPTGVAVDGRGHIYVIDEYGLYRFRLR